MSNRRQSGATGDGPTRVLPRAGGNQPNAFIGILLGFSSVYLSISARKKAMFYLVWIAFLSILSAFVELDTAHSYFTQKHNILNQFGVKIGWFWTCIVVGPFIYYVSKGSFPDSNRFAKDLSRLAAATGLWYFTVQVFHRILHATSRCDVGGFGLSRADCSLKGGKWLLGFDISGHCFLMLFSVLIITEESGALRAFLRQCKERPDYTKEYTTTVNGFYLAMAALHLFWDFQLIISSLYYHIMFDKVAGAATAVGCWALIYRIGCRSGILPFPPGTERKVTTKKCAHK